MTISKDRVKPSPQPDSWKLAEIFTTGIILGGYLAMMTVIFFWAAYKTDFFPVSLIIFLLNDHHAGRGRNYYIQLELLFLGGCLMFYIDLIFSSGYHHYHPSI